jgi:NAD(P)-dependent dehydrogenase (short-subunit alcohol dehydrogenase family)
LIANILAANAPRIVNVSSAIHYSGVLDFDTFEQPITDYSGMKFYAQSKLANILFTKSLAKRYPKILVNALHPGVVGTNFGNGEMKWYFKGIWTIMKPFLLTAEKGARTSIYLASSPLVDVSGKYFDKSAEKRPSKLADDQALAEKLWAYSEAVIQKA